MRRCIVFLVFTITSTLLHAQILTFDHGKISFKTSSIMSDIEGVSEDFEVNLDLASGKVDISIPITSFEFEYGMMQDHFNEEYLESDQYPKATFEGKITQDISNIIEAEEVNVTGEMTIHGVTKSMSFKTILSKKDGLTKVKCTFPIVFKDFNVDEPSILSRSVAKDVELKGLFYLK